MTDEKGLYRAPNKHQGAAVETGVDCDAVTRLPPRAPKLGLAAVVGANGGRRWVVVEKDPRQAQLDTVPLLIDEYNTSAQNQSGL